MFRCVANCNDKCLAFLMPFLEQTLLPGTITLEGTNATFNETSHRGHVYFSGRPLCSATEGGNTTWDINASNVVCRMLGFSGATSTFSVDGCPYGGCTEGVAFGFSGFKCNGNEAHILDCPHDKKVTKDCGTDGATNSNQNDIVGVQCTGEH